jgi:2-methylisocitrate lyase-like PEP mutase family enzyme
LTRAAAYAEAGADGIFVPGVVDAATVTALVEGIPVPLNVLAGPGGPGVAAIAQFGAARISVGSSIAEAAYAVVRRATRELLADGTYDALTGALGNDELNALSH